MMKECKNLLSNMAGRGEETYSAQQAERLEEIKKHIYRLRKFLLNDHGSTDGSTITNPNY